MAAAVLVAATAYVTVMSAYPRARQISLERPTAEAPPAATPTPSATPLSRIEPPTRPAAESAVASAHTPTKASAAAMPSLSPRTGRSPLEGAPGYFPPADPESASVRRGRREAPVISTPFQGGAGSMDEFGRLVVAALNANDEAALRALRVTRSEFETIIWREFPESRPITNITAEDAWSLSEPRSLSGASRAMGAHGGRRLRYLKIEAQRIQEFTNFLLHRDVTIFAVNDVTAEIHQITLAPSVAERKGRFKALLYRD